MSYKGRYLVGDRVPLSLWCRNNADLAALPDDAPLGFVFSDTALVQVVRLPILDRYKTTAFFQLPLLLDGKYAAGNYRVVYQYSVSSTQYGDEDSFQVVAGGSPDGAGLSMYYYDRPTASYVLQQTDLGRVLRRRNPRM